MHDWKFSQCEKSELYLIINNDVIYVRLFLFLRVP